MIERRTLLVSAAATALLALGACAGMPTEGRVSDTALLDELLRLETASWQYTVDRNAAGLGQFLADDALLITVDGTRFTKAGYIAALAETNLQGFTIGPNPVLLRYSADVAAIVYAVTYSARPAGGAAMTLSVLATSVFARRDGRWVSVHYQETPGR